MILSVQKEKLPRMSAPPPPPIQQIFPTTPIYQASTFVCILLVTNNAGISVAPTVKDTCTVPGTFTSVSSVPSASSSTISGTGFTNTYGTIANGAKINITATFVVDPLAAAGNYANTIKVTAFGGLITLATNTVTVTVSAGTPVLEIEITNTGVFNKDNVANSVEFIGPIRNVGTATATNLVVNLTCTAPGQISALPYGTSSTGTFLYNLPNLAPGAFTGFSFQQIDSTLTSGVFTSYATVSATGAVKVSDSASFERLIMTILENVNDPTVVANQVIAYTINLDNRSGMNVSGYSISSVNTLPGAFTSVTSSANVTMSNLVISGNTFSVDLGTIIRKPIVPSSFITAYYTVSSGVTYDGILYINTATLHSPTQSDFDALAITQIA